MMKTMSAIFAAILAVIVFAACNPSGDIDEWQNKTDETFTVTFNANGGTSTPAPQTVVKGGKVTEPATITKSGFTLGGWYTDNDTFTNQWNFATNTVTANITLYAKWDTHPNITYYTVTFDVNGGAQSLTTQNVAEGDKAIVPEGVTKSGYTLDGWYKEAALTNQWNFATDTVTANITLYAKWNQNLPGTFTVTFVSNGGSQVADQPVTSGHTATAPTSVIKANHTFGGWYKEQNFINLWDFATDTVTGAITLYAKWNIDRYTVTFNADGGTPEPDQQTVNHGDKVTQPTGVTKTGYTLNGWYREPAFTTQWNFATDTVTGAITLYAKWNIDRYTVTFNADGGTPGPVQQTVNHGGKVTQPTGVIKTGYTLNGWYKEPAFTNRWNFTTDTVTANITLYAKWIEHLPPDVIEMEWIEAGTFTMGSSDSQDYDANPPHQVTLTQGFYMGKYEVTQEQYQAVMGSHPSYFTTDAAEEETQGRRPVERVTWYDALVFCNKLSMMKGLVPAYRISNSTNPEAWGPVPTGTSNATWNAVTIDSDANGYRLPTEAQWEYACRAGRETPWHTASGTDSDLDNYAWYTLNSDNRTHEVGLKSPNAWGLYDMHGNVLELCWDRYGTYPNSAQTDPTGAASGTYRVERGGAWISDGQYVRSAYRRRYIIGDRGYELGFRLVRPSN